MPPICFSPAPPRVKGKSPSGARSAPADLRLIRQLLTESLLLSAMGWRVSAIAMASGFVRAFPSIFPAVQLPATATLEVDGRVLLFTLAVAFATSIFFRDSLPHGRLPEPIRSMLSKKVEGWDPAGEVTDSGRALVATEVALALVLLIGAGLMMKRLVQMNDIVSGVRTLKRTHDGPQLARNDKHTPTLRASLAFFEMHSSGFEATPRRLLGRHCHDSSSCRDRDSLWRFDVAGSEYSGADANVQRVSPGYFHAMGFEIREGRLLSDSDTEASARVAVVNETFAERYVSDGDVLQREFQMQKLFPHKKELGAQESWRIVGVVKSVRVFGLLDDETSEVYIPYLQSLPTSAALAIHTATDPEDLIKPVRAAILSVDKDLPPTQIATMESILARAISQPEFRSHLLGLFATVAVILAALGIYGVMTCAASGAHT